MHPHLTPAKNKAGSLPLTSNEGLHCCMAEGYKYRGSKVMTSVPVQSTRTLLSLPDVKIPFKTHWNLRRKVGQIRWCDGTWKDGLEQSRLRLDKKKRKITKSCSTKSKVTQYVVYAVVWILVLHDMKRKMCNIFQ